jgi:DNA processing protein
MQRIEFKSNNFPLLLRDIAAPPKELYVLGSIPDLPMVAIVGSRALTEYGQYMTYRLAYDLAKAGMCVVSGMALGVDAIAHQAALDAGGATLAVLAGGLDNPSPRSNYRLFERILNSGGGVISEYPAGTTPFKQNFPARNRIIAGLSLCTIITEANASSGSLITANFALQANRMVMAVPGNVTSPRSAGPNNLLKVGAKPVTDAVDVLAELGLESTVVKAKRVKADSAQEARIMELIEAGHHTTDALITKSEIDPSQIASVLSLMEITGKVRNIGAGQWILTS